MLQAFQSTESGVCTAEKQRHFKVQKSIQVNPYESLLRTQPISRFIIKEPYQLDMDPSIVLHDIPMSYKTWGTLNDTCDNCIVICHALTGSAEVEDWWGNEMIGPGCVLDTRCWFIICLNVPGSPYGSVSPLNAILEIKEEEKGGISESVPFPFFSVRDAVRLHRRVLNHLGVLVVQCVIGGSLGGMQALEWSFFGPQYVRTIIPIACTAKATCWILTFNETQRLSIMNDPNFMNGKYESFGKFPVVGLSTARKQALPTYRSAESFERRFGCDPLAYRSYLNYQGAKFVKRFDANCYLSLLDMMDGHDIGRGRNGTLEALKSIRQPVLAIGVSDDILVPFSMFKQEFSEIPDCDIKCLESREGHDAFLLSTDVMGPWISDWLANLMTDDQREMVATNILDCQNPILSVSVLCRED